MPVEFLSDEEAAAYGRFGGPPSRAELERVFFIDDADRALIAGHRGEHNRLGFALQLTTVRSVGLFLADPLEVRAGSCISCATSPRRTRRPARGVADDHG